MTTIMQCPVCRRPLRPAPGCYQCDANHNFDIARQGYVNLVLAHNKHSKEPGDGPDMIRSRHRFLDQGFYDRVAEAVNATSAAILAGLPGNSAGNLLDAGCGEGFYLQRLKAALDHGYGAPRSLKYHGVDVSRFAVQQATRRDRTMAWFVASINDLPFLDASLDIVLNIFSPASIPEFARIIKPDGRLVFVSPGPKHLNGLREIIYPVTREHQPPSITAKARDLFILANETRISYQLELKGRETIMDLLAMTPYFWNIDLATKAKVEELEQLTLDVDVEIRVFAKRAGVAPAT